MFTLTAFIAVFGLAFTAAGSLIGTQCLTSSRVCVVCADTGTFNELVASALASAFDFSNYTFLLSAYQSPHADNPGPLCKNRFISGPQTMPNTTDVIGFVHFIQMAHLPWSNMIIAPLYTNTVVTITTSIGAFNVSGHNIAFSSLQSETNAVLIFSTSARITLSAVTSLRLLESAVIKDTIITIGNASSGAVFMANTMNLSADGFINVLDPLASNVSIVTLMTSCTGASCSNARITPTSIAPFGLLTIMTQLTSAFPQCPRCPKSSTRTSYVGIIVITVLFFFLALLYFVFERHEKRKPE